MRKNGDAGDAGDDDPAAGLLHLLASECGVEICSKVRDPRSYFVMSALVPPQVITLWLCRSRSTMQGTDIREAGFSRVQLVARSKLSSLTSSGSPTSRA
ncbi:uncharacterized protein N7473_012304 [Penicillium subrubescens]|uniref:uncharacterized protein n=1 Tax=Penicillium subrubescens TaxID=1316194 RepID=UPI002545108F|nr:uncharacterized protein N7473_012304 [Penicillium subrubescens]KAJ5881251.1 hypothetical protein N7473_012304 [Penicillium subrubescens]